MSILTNLLKNHKNKVTKLRIVEVDVNTIPVIRIK